MFAEDGWLYGGEPAGALGMWLLVEGRDGMEEAVGLEGQSRCMTRRVIYASGMQ